MLSFKNLGVGIYSRSRNGVLKKLGFRKKITFKEYQLMSRIGFLQKLSMETKFSTFSFNFIFVSLSPMPPLSFF